MIDFENIFEITIFYKNIFQNYYFFLSTIKIYLIKKDIKNLILEI